MTFLTKIAKLSYYNYHVKTHVSNTMHFQDEMDHLFLLQRRVFRKKKVLVNFIAFSFLKNP